MSTPITQQVECAVRRQWVAATPEEMVRQRLLLKLTRQLGYPLSHIAVEVALHQMPHLQVKPKLSRRADIVCYAPNLRMGYPLYPLLLIECKAVPLNARVIQQVVGYNQYVQACYVVIANACEERVGWFDSCAGEYQFFDGLPTYASGTSLAK